MNKGLKLLVETPTYEIDYIIEEKNKNEPRSMYITGPFLMAESKNKNGRIYKLEEMIPEVDRFLEEMVKPGRALGELNHPTSVEINPERACHMITEMKQDGKMFMGKSKILSSPMGMIVRSLLEDGVKLGVSSRALGKLTETPGGNQVSDFRLICCDVVHDPSVPDAFVNGILEAKEYAIKCDGGICTLYDKFEESLETLPRHNAEQHVKDSIMEFLNKLKS
jgi:hypothetical protein